MTSRDYFCQGGEKFIDPAQTSGYIRNNLCIATDAVVLSRKASSFARAAASL